MKSNVIVVQPDKLRNAPARNTITLNASQQQYFLHVALAATRLLQNITMLDTEEKIFGNGEFFWPKDPSKPDQLVKLYRAFDIPGMRLQLERAEKSLPWTKAKLIITPPNFPHDAYQLNLSEQIKNKFTLIDTKLVEHADETPRRVKIYSFLLISDRSIRYDFHQNADPALPEEKFPTRFFGIEIKKTQ